MACENIAIYVRTRVRARAGYIRGRRAGRAYLLSKRKRKMRKNESGEHAGNRLGECMATGRTSVRVARGRANGMIGQTIIWKVDGEMVET